MLHPVIRIISGGQTGADFGGLIAAKECGIETGGWMPKGWITQDGPKPHFKDLYGMQEHTSSSYVPRTYANVKDSDGTIRFAKFFSSPGELCTLKAIRQYDKPYWDINIENPRKIVDTAAWLVTNNIKILNIAGNAEAKFPGICYFTAEYLKKLFKRKNNDDKSQ